MSRADEISKAASQRLPISNGAWQRLPFHDCDEPLEARLDDLLGRLSLVEKAQQMLHEAPAIPRLGIPAYNWWNECLHGLARAGTATVFPQAIALAASFDSELLHEVARATSDEARAKHHAYAAAGDRGYYKGLTFFAPNVNIFRDPRWGRGHETYGECPFLTARLAVATVRGLEGDDVRYLKLVATAKHFAVHSGPEGLRHGFDARPSPQDLFSTYLPAFHALVTEARVHSVMTAYNRLNGEPCSGSRFLLRELLREAWGFEGYVVSDCWAIRDFHEQHGVTTRAEESAALALRAGCDLNCGCTYGELPRAVEQGLVSEQELDTCVRRLFRARLLLGMFDPPERVPYAGLPLETCDCAAHRALSRRAAASSLVLLKNDGVLPLSRELRALAVIGPNANAPSVLLGNYAGTPSRSVTPLQGIIGELSPGTQLYYAEGCKLQGTDQTSCAPHANLSEARLYAERADVCVVVLGLSPEIEGEQGDASNSEAAGDKLDLELPGLQQQLLEVVAGAGKPVVLVVISGSALNLGWADKHVSAIVQAFYPGQEGGSALAEVLFGDVSPAGRLPVTFPRSLSDLPAFHDYAMQGRTYRFLAHPPLYPFGYGLSYASFDYTALEVAPSSKLEACVELQLNASVTVTNTGQCAADEVVQLYVRDHLATTRVAHHELRGIRRVHLAPGASARVRFELGARDLSLIDDFGKRRLEPGCFTLYAGGSQPDARSRELLGKSPLSIEIELTGGNVELSY
jgi:beta-glucosidase